MLLLQSRWALYICPLCASPPEAGREAAVWLAAVGRKIGDRSPRSDFGRNGIPVKEQMRGGLLRCLLSSREAYGRGWVQIALSSSGALRWCVRSSQLPATPPA